MFVKITEKGILDEEAGFRESLLSLNSNNRASSAVEHETFLISAPFIKTEFKNTA